MKVRYRGLVKNTAQVLTLFALSNLWMVRRQLLPKMGELRLQDGEPRHDAQFSAKARNENDRNTPCAGNRGIRACCSDLP